MSSSRRRQHRRHEFPDLPAYRPRRSERRKAHQRKRRARAWGRYRKLTITALIGAVLLVAGAAVWFNDDTGLNERVAAAARLQSTAQHAAAAVALKELLIAAPDHAQARWQLGQALIALDDGAGALKELERAESLGFRHAQLFSSKLIAMLLDGKFDQALRQLVFVSSIETDSVLLEIQARAQLGLGDPRAARRTLEQAVAADPNRAQGRLWLGRVALREGDLRSAGEQAEILTLDPQAGVDAWLLRAEIDLAADRAEDAELGFRAALGMAGDNIVAKVGLARSLLLQSRPETARTLLEEVLRDSPQHPMGSFLLAHTLLQLNQDVAAITKAREVLSRFPKHPPTLLLLGLLSLKHGDLAQAELVLRRLVSGDPGHVQGQSLLAAVEMQTGRAAAALARLEPVYALAPESVELATLLGAARSRSGRVEEAVTGLQEVAERSPPTPGLLSELGFAHLAAGRLDEGVTALRRAIEIDPRYGRAYLLLGAAELESGRHDDAIATLTALTARDPASVRGWHLLGLAYVARGDTTRGREHLQRSLSQAPEFIPALWSIARLEQVEGNTVAARQHYQTLLRLDPEHVQAHYELALLERRAGAAPQARAQLETVLRLEPRHLEAARTLVRQHLSTGELAAAARVLETAWKSNPAPELAGALADVMVAAGDYPGARRALSLAAADSDPTGALAARGKVIDLLLDPTRRLEPSSRGSELNLLTRGVSALARGELDRAEAIARDLSRRFADSASSEVLLADVYSSRGNFRAAAAALENALPLDASPSLLARAVNAWQMLGAPERAERILNERLRERPRDLAARALYGALSLRQGHLAQAQEHYEALLREHPASPEGLNNLAWLYHRNDDARALRLAEDAYRIAGHLPEIADTYGWLLVELGQASKGREILEQALIDKPDDASLRYHLAVALVRTEARDEARKILMALRTDAPEFAERDAAAALLARLGPPAG